MSKAIPKALDAEVRTIYFDGQSKRRPSVASFKRLVRACKIMGLSDDAAKVGVLSIYDYGARLSAELVLRGVVTMDQVGRSKG